MDIFIERVRDEEQQRAAAAIRRTVFENELGLPRAVVDERRKVFELIAYAAPQATVCATLMALETSGDDALHASYRLGFDRYARVIRYAQLAVLKKWRGRAIPLLLLREAMRITAAAGFRYMWLLFDAERAARSSFRKVLGFHVGIETFATSSGISRVLMLDRQCASSKDEVDSRVYPINGAYRSNTSNGSQWRNPISSPFQEHSSREFGDDNYQQRKL